ncbi:hypothetical protein [Leifsonia sp. NPDC077715]|uniref:hypothetical protein n=1 Tax=Leifsonia sp. NPDC077715 TaxID=3155539 RepID=UPI00343D7B65
MKVSSNIAAAKEAVAGFAALGRGERGQQATLTASNVSGMHDGARVANGIVNCVARLLSAAKGQADRVTALAVEIEERDKRDSRGLGEKR